jgi:hypothetical protein
MRRNLRLKLLLGVLLLAAGLLIPVQALAQTYLFQLDELSADVYWNQDGTSAIDYYFTFTNNPSASPIEFVDVGIPNANFSTALIKADVDGNPVTDISTSGYQGKGTGVAVGLGQYAIPPGRTGTLHVIVGQVSKVLYPDSTDSNYASAVFVPTYFGSQYVRGSTKLTVTFHLPPGVQPQEPRWHESPSGWNSQPETSLDAEGRVAYTWRNASANGYTSYQFGASFPNKYVPAGSIVQPGLLERLGIDPDLLIFLGICGSFFAFFVLVVGASYYGTQHRKLQYLPPKISIEGHGIKRGLTAVEAAVLLEQGLDKIMTMILFGVLKKNAAQVTSREPLEVKAADDLPKDLYEYEAAFLAAFDEPNKAKRRTALQKMTIALIDSVTQKMKGFSRKETVAYYKNITDRAWEQVQAAGTPEVKSQKYDEVMEWTMLDKDYDRRTRDVFQTGPVFVPVWWGRYDPGFGRSTVPTPSTAPSGGGSISLPTLPGGEFAASVVLGAQNFSSGVIGNLAEFTGGVTTKTNPIPVPTKSSYRGGGGGGGGCACACACAGCACACAGGGR